MRKRIHNPAREDVIFAADVKNGMEFNIPAELQASRVIVKSVKDLSHKLACAPDTFFELEVEPVSGPFKGQQTYIIVQHDTELGILKRPVPKGRGSLYLKSFPFGRVLEFSVYFILFAAGAIALYHGAVIEIPHSTAIVGPVISE